MTNTTKRPNEPGDSLWRRNLDEIDERIKRWAADTGETVKENFDELEDNIRAWFNEQDMDERARAEWEDLKLDTKLLQNKIKHRYRELVDEGKIRLSRKGSGGS